MEYLNRLSSLVASPAKTASNIGAARRRKASVQFAPGSPEAFERDWEAVKNTLQKPDERALFFGIDRTDLPDRLRRLVDALVFESNRSTEGHTGPCMEYLLKHELLEELVHLSSHDQPLGILGEVIRTLTNLVILLDEKFLSRQAAHKPISLLIDLCMSGGSSDDDQDDPPSSTLRRAVARHTATDLNGDYHGDLVDLMCHVSSRIRNTPDLLLIFFSDQTIKASSMAEIAEENTVVLVADQDEQDQPLEIRVRPPSPAGSIDSVATLQPTKIEALTTNPADSQPTLFRKLKFPLFSYLLRFAHREGRIGELARAGLLFLITLEVDHAHTRPKKKGSTGAPGASSEFPATDTAEARGFKVALATFVANSDFADVFGAGLGAAYGLLPTRIHMAPVHDPTRGPRSDRTLGRAKSEISLGSAIARSEPDNHSSNSFSAATRSDNPDLHAQLRLLVDLLDFAQDVLDAVGLNSRFGPRALAQGVESPQPIDAMVEKLAMSVAMAVRDTFIQNVVYPSLMESSDVDGSATAVMSYLDVVMLVLRERHMLTEVVLQYLLCYERLPSSDSHFDELDATASRLAYRLADDGADRYSLKDLILDNMAPGRAISATTAAMKLAKSIIQFHGRHANDALLEARKPAQRSIAHTQAARDEEDGVDNVWAGTGSGAAHKAPESVERMPLKVADHVKEIDAYAALLSRIEPGASLETLLVGLSPYLLEAEQGIRHDSCFDVAVRPLSRRRTEMAASGERSDPAHWFQVRLSPRDTFFEQICELLARFFRQSPEQNLALTGIITALALSPIRSLKGWLTYDWEQSGEGAVPAMLDLLSLLSRQVEGYRQNVADFDRYLAERRKGLLLAEDLCDALEVSDLTGDDSTDEKGAHEEGGSKKLAPSLSLPRIRAWKGRGETEPEGERSGLEALAVLEDLRRELPAESEALVSVPGTTDEQRTTAADSEGDGGKSSVGDSRSSALARLFGGRNAKAGISNATSKVQQQQRQQPHHSQQHRDKAIASEGGRVAASTLSPYTRHYQETLAVFVRATTVPGAKEWRGQHHEKSSAEQRDGEGTVEEERSKREEQEGEDSEKVTLSSVLDNTILLEELIKEIVAIVDVRRAWGIDPIAFRRAE